MIQKVIAIFFHIHLLDHCKPFPMFYRILLRVGLKPHDILQYVTDRKETFLHHLHGEFCQMVWFDKQDCFSVWPQCLKSLWQAIRIHQVRFFPATCYRWPTHRPSHQKFKVFAIPAFLTPPPPPSHCMEGCMKGKFRTK